MDTEQKDQTTSNYDISYIKLTLFILLIIAAMLSPLVFRQYSSALFVSQTLPNMQLVSAATAMVIEPFHAKARERFQSNPPKLEAQAAIVWDINSKSILYEKNIDSQLPLASLTKLMTAFIASENLNYSIPIIIQAESLSQEGDSGLLANESWNVSELLDFALIVSSNDAAHVLATKAGESLINDSGTSPIDDAHALFVNRMNEEAGNIGLTQTYFINETGLDPSDAVSGSYGSVKDMALLMQHILENNSTLLSATTALSREFTSLDGFIHPATNTNQLVNNIPWLLASKTGFTDLAGGNLVIAFDAGLNKPIVIVVLGSSFDGRFTDVEKLINVLLTPAQ